MESTKTPGMFSETSHSVGARGHERRLECLRALERKVLWLSAWIIHHANHVRKNRDGLKVGGHQASCASTATLMTALYFDVLRAQDRVAVKPHASPTFHAIQYLLGRQTRDKLERFRALGGIQAYPSRTKDSDGVDFSTGSVGLGVAMTAFAALAQDYVRARNWAAKDAPEGRMIALVGDAELDEGNTFEALSEGWKQHIRNVWWIVDYNRQSLDSIVDDRLFPHLENTFKTMDWRVVTVKYGARLQAAFQRPGGDALQNWIDNCPNSLYSMLAYKGGEGWREHIRRDLGSTVGITQLLDEHDNERLNALMTNLGGQDMSSVLETLHGINDDSPTCIIAYTIKGYSLPFAGHKDNHSGLMTPEQINELRRSHGISAGEEWDLFAGLELPADDLQSFLAAVPLSASKSRCHEGVHVEIPLLTVPSGSSLSTQEAFGRLLNELAKTSDPWVDRIVTTSPDVSISTNLGPWVNRRGVFRGRFQADLLENEQVLSAQKWICSPAGQHIELGIAENSMCLLLGALGLSEPLFGAKLFPIGTVYDPFISRGLDALNYACYQGARFLLVGTPSGLTLASEGGAHQSVYTPLIGIGQPGLTAFEPAYADELAVILRWAFEQMQADDGGAVYLRLSTRRIDQQQRQMTEELKRDVIRGGYWLVEPGSLPEVIVVCTGAIVPEAMEAIMKIKEDLPDAGLLVVTSADRLHADWLAGHRRRTRRELTTTSHANNLLAPVPTSSTLITILDGHPAALTWIGGVIGHRVIGLGLDTFGQSGDLADLYRTYRLDAGAIIDAAARACLDRVSPQQVPCNS